MVDRQTDEVAIAMEQLRKSVTWAEVYNSAEVNVSALAIQKTLLGYERMSTELAAAKEEIEGLKFIPSKQIIAHKATLEENANLKKLIASLRDYVESQEVLTRAKEGGGGG